MSEDEITEYRKKIINELIEFGVTIAVVIVLTFIQHPDSLERAKLRMKKYFKEETPDPHAQEVRQFAQEVSDWEHAEAEKRK